MEAEDLPGKLLGGPAPGSVPCQHSEYRLLSPLARRQYPAPQTVHLHPTSEEAIYAETAAPDWCRIGAWHSLKQHSGALGNLTSSQGRGLGATRFVEAAPACRAHHPRRTAGPFCRAAHPRHRTPAEQRRAEDCHHRLLRAGPARQALRGGGHARPRSPFRGCDRLRAAYSNIRPIRYR